MIPLENREADDARLPSSFDALAHGLDIWRALGFHEPPFGDENLVHQRIRDTNSPAEP
jgi:hypothetical protein